MCRETGRGRGGGKRSCPQRPFALLDALPAAAVLWPNAWSLARPRSHSLSVAPIAIMWVPRGSRAAVTVAGWRRIVALAAVAGTMSLDNVPRTEAAAVGTSRGVAVLDQHTDHSGAVRDVAMHQPTWQQWTPSWTGDLEQIDVYLGSAVVRAAGVLLLWPGGGSVVSRCSPHVAQPVPTGIPSLPACMVACFVCVQLPLSSVFSATLTYVWD